MNGEIHPIPPSPRGAAPGSAATYRRPRRRGRRVAAALAAGLALGAGVVAVSQLPLHSTHVGTVVTATQNPDDETIVPAAEPREREHAAAGSFEDD